MDFIFRAANLDDIAELVNLRFSLINEDGLGDQVQRTPVFESYVRDYFTNAISDRSYFGSVAEADGRLVSNIGLVLYRKPPSFNGQNGLVGYLSNAYTLPEFRNRGIASELMKIIIAHAELMKIAKIHLGTSEDGRKLYAKFGFKDVQFPALELRLN